MEQHRCQLSFEGGPARCIEKPPCPNQLLIRALNLDLHCLVEKRREAAIAQRDIQELEIRIRETEAEITGNKIRSL